MTNILIVDDDQMITGLITGILKKLGHGAIIASTLESGLAKAYSEKVDIALVDVNLPDGSGLNSLRKFKEAPSKPEVLIITGEGSRIGAERAYQSGAWDYIEKPFHKVDLELSIARALEYRGQKKAAAAPRLLNRDEIIGRSPLINNQLAIVAQASAGNASVLIQGETGTGKELFARAIHVNSNRADKNFVVVDCASLPESLVEAILFGHVDGAFTNAVKSSDGLIKQADNGTLFLDEIGELPLDSQKSLLRVLQERKFRPIGSAKEAKSDFRLVAATNRNLEELVKTGGFRDDLLFRVSSFTLNLPQLRDRREDIKDLVYHFITVICDDYRQDTKGFSPDFLNFLQEYEWPGNVRELYNTLEYAIASAGHDPILYRIHLPGALKIGLNRPATESSVFTPAPAPLPDKITTDSEIMPLKAYRQCVVEEAEKNYLEKLMAHASGNVKKACRLSQVSIPRLYALLKKYRIKTKEI